MSVQKYLKAHVSLSNIFLYIQFAKIIYDNLF